MKNNSITAVLAVFVLAASVMGAGVDKKKTQAPAVAAAAPAIAAPSKCANGDLLGFNPDGKVCWGQDYDSIGRLAMKIINDKISEIQKLTIQNDLYLGEVLRLRNVCPNK